MLDVVSVWDARGCISWLNGCSVLWAVKVVMYTIGVGTVVRELGIRDDVYLLHWVLVMDYECGGVRCIA